MPPTDACYVSRPDSDWLLRCCLCLGIILSNLLAAPGSIAFEHLVQQGSHMVTIDFKPYSVRGPNFEVLAQQDDGTLAAVDSGVVETYIGTVKEHPGAIAAGLVRADGRVFTRVSFEDGMEWYSAGGEARIKGELNEVIWPSLPTLAGGAGGQIYAAEVGVDVDSYYIEEFGGRSASLEMVEYAIVVTNAIYLRDVGIEHRLGRLILRESEEANPYDFELDPDQNFLDVFYEVATQWREVLPGGSEDVVLFASSRGYGGWGDLRMVGSPAGVTTNIPLEPFEEGDVSNIWRHEVGHNWGVSHFEGGTQTADQEGRGPEWKTVMSGNQLSRLSVSEAAVILGYRDEIADSLDSMGPFPLPIPPRASMDRYIYIEGQRFDVLKNDHDSNGQQIVLSDIESVSQLGGEVERSVGSGPDGRDELIYRAPEDTGDWDYDRFTYRIEDSEGLQALGNVIVWNRGAAAGLTDTDGDGQPDICTNLLIASFGGAGESYTRVDASGEPSGLSSIEGEYIRFPEENGYHRGELTHVADNIYLWTNASGVSWQMTLDTEKFNLVDEVGSPYELTRSLSYYDLSNCGGMIEDIDDDNDGLADSRERELGTDPIDTDSDRDGVIDGVEVDRELDPLSSDSDGDGFSDGEELSSGSDPANSESVPAPDSVLRISLEEPVSGQIHTGVGNLRGWAVATEGITKIEIFIDNVYAFDAPYGGSRGDVGGAFPDVPGSSDSGFSLAFNYSNLAVGTHTITAMAHTPEGATRESSASFEVVRFESPFIADQNAVDLNGGSCAASSDEITILDARVEGSLYDLVLKWRTAEQGFAIVEIR